VRGEPIPQGNFKRLSVGDEFGKILSKLPTRNWQFTTGKTQNRLSELIHIIDTHLFHIRTTYFDSEYSCVDLKRGCVELFKGEWAEPPPRAKVASIERTSRTGHGRYKRPYLGQVPSDRGGSRHGATGALAPVKQLIFNELGSNLKGIHMKILGNYHH
jgi:hypothetical protein